MIIPSSELAAGDCHRFTSIEGRGTGRHIRSSCPLDSLLGWAYSSMSSHMYESPLVPARSGVVSTLLTEEQTNAVINNCRLYEVIIQNTWRIDSPFRL